MREASLRREEQHHLQYVYVCMGKEGGRGGEEREERGGGREGWEEGWRGEEQGVGEVRREEREEGGEGRGGEATGSSLLPFVILLFNSRPA